MLMKSFYRMALAAVVTSAALGVEVGNSENIKTEQVWNQANAFEGWQALRNVKCEVKDHVLVLTEIKNDSQVVSGPLKLDPARFTGFSFRYR